MVVVAGAALVAFVIYVVVSQQPAPTRTMADAPPVALRYGTTAPTFSLPRLGGGPPVSLAADRGRDVIVNFFASWCSHCRAELAAFAAVGRLSADRVAMVGVDTDDPATAQVERLLAAARTTYPVGLDPKAQVAAHYLVTALPVTYFIGPRGQVLGEAFGVLRAATVEQWVDAHTPAPPRSPGAPAPPAAGAAG